MRGILWRGIAVSALLTIGAGFVVSVSAARFNSTNYIIDASVNNTFGGQSGSSSYKLTASGGESLVGNGASGSYKLGAGYVAQLEASSYNLTVQPSGLVAYYPFDEGAGAQVYDSTANNNTGSTVNSPTWATGKLSGGMQFNGVDQSVQVAPSSALNIESMSLEAWIKTSQVPSTSDVTIVEKRGLAGAYPYSLRLLSSGKLQFAAFDGTTYVYTTSGVVVNDGAWHHYVGVRQVGGQMILYKDGALSSEVADFTTAGTTTNTSGITIGARSDGTRAFDGSIDELKVYNRSLTSAEVKAEYDAQNAGYKSGLSLNSLIAGTSQTAGFDVISVTNQTGYNLAIQQNQNLTSGSDTISSVSGSIASPAAWSEGTTKGLGFTVVSAPDLPFAWNSGANYAALPSSATTFYTRSGYTAGTKDTVAMRLRADISAGQALGDYSNIMTITGTTTP
jgi:hypothetical protein